MPQGVAKARPQPPSGTIKVAYISDSRVYVKDSLPEWSKGVDSSSTSASCVGSNPTGVIFPALALFNTGMRDQPGNFTRNP